MDKQQQIQRILERSVEHIYPKREFLESLLNSDKKLKVYLGIDPTGPTLHLGHVICLRKLRQFQDLGHKIILLIGSFTAMIGDPTDKKAVRKTLTREDVLKNSGVYKEQASHFIKFDGDNPAELKYNSDWFDKMTFLDVINIAPNFTVGQMLERDMFQERIKNEKPIYLHEFLYPLMQGYDSIAMDIDGEVGGNDQTFNMLAGRSFMKNLKNKEKFVISSKLLADSSGKKMGKTESNMLSLIDSSEDMYGKVMSWTDGMILAGFELCTDIPLEEIVKMGKAMKDDVNPRDFKMKLAYSIVDEYYGKKSADKAQDNFKNIFQKQGKPDEISEFKAGKDKIQIIELLKESRLASSNTEARHLIEQKGVKIDDKVIEDVKAEIIIPEKGIILQKGKLHYLKVTI